VRLIKFTVIRFCISFSTHKSNKRPNSKSFVGIGGTAVASAAVAMKEKGVAVTGSDQNVYPTMSTFWAGKQIKVINS